jgi:N6-adenosine-specific RNA methylase IME4
MKKYKIIYADPAWNYNDKCLHSGGAEKYYRTMNDEDIKNLPVNKIADDDCILFMWTTFPKLQVALDVINAWGFQYKTNAFTWIKKNKKADSLFWGMGRWTRGNAEICLLAVKGRPKRIDMGVHSVIYAPIDKHSRKPQEARDRIIRLVGDLPKIELFAREALEGWDVWGNEVENSIVF